MGEADQQQVIMASARLNEFQFSLMDGLASSPWVLTFELTAASATSTLTCWQEADINKSALMTLCEWVGWQPRIQATKGSTALETLAAFHFISPRYDFYVTF